MFTCKDCAHYEACQEMYDLLTSLEDIDMLDNKYAEQGCLLFKNKADFVEIPCRCKECEHFINYNPDRTYCAKHSDVWSDSTVYVDKDDYCSFGIRKKEGADNG